MSFSGVRLAGRGPCRLLLYNSHLIEPTRLPHEHVLFPTLKSSPVTLDNTFVEFGNNLLYASRDTVRAGRLCLLSNRRRKETGPRCLENKEVLTLVCKLIYVQIMSLLATICGLTLTLRRGVVGFHNTTMFRLLYRELEMGRNDIALLGRSSSNKDRSCLTVEK